MGKRWLAFSVFRAKSAPSRRSWGDLSSERRRRHPCALFRSLPTVVLSLENVLSLQRLPVPPATVLPRNPFSPGSQRTACLFLLPDSRVSAACLRSHPDLSHVGREIFSWQFPDSTPKLGGGVLTTYSGKQQFHNLSLPSPRPHCCMFICF